MPKIHPGSAFDLAGYQLKGEYTFNAPSTAEVSAQATARREQMRQSNDPAQRYAAQGTIPGMGTPKPTPMHLVRPAKRGKK
jgi:hypothetical protein